MQYNIQDDTWQKSAAKFQNGNVAGVGAVTDPRTGWIYLTGGYDDRDPTSPLVKLLDIFDPVSQTIHTSNLPNREKTFPVPWYSGNVWSKYKNSIIYWGGLNDTEPDPRIVTNGVTELSTDFMTWSTMLGT
ncbi:hypothetical protein BGZ97_000814 [Linnemannia gamsii]|uniref:Galactose oxidase n=1 Tax=Linnemannia gamsii TaxID=64522 RepID=A0A9P6QXI8_9FUNG|nr:hypothetical protein BGZ97_000814 [Linnemannia gamsii]